MKESIYIRSMPLLNCRFEEEELVIPTINWNVSLSVLYFQKTLSFLIASVLLLNAIGYYPLFKVKQWQIRTEMKSAIKNSLSNKDLKCITITSDNTNELIWEEFEEREFTYRNIKYDIVRAQQSGGTTYYYCIEDTQETKLFAALDKEVKRYMEDEKNPLRRTIKKIIKTFSCQTFLVYINYSAQQEMSMAAAFDFLNCAYEYDFSDPIILPPEQLI